MVDCCGMNRIPGREEIFETAPVKAVIDHHGVTGEQTNFDFGRIEPDSAATGEMIELLIEAMNVEIDLPMAEGIFTAITTDTGNFQHANTTARTHEMAAQLHRVPGFNCKKISNLIYNRNSLRSIRLHSLVMSSLQLFGEDKVAVAAVTGYLCIRLLKYIADKGRFGAFAYYCWAAGVLTLVLQGYFRSVRKRLCVKLEKLLGAA